MGEMNRQKNVQHDGGKKLSTSVCVRHQVTNAASLPPQMISPFPLTLFFFAVDCFLSFAACQLLLHRG